MSSNLCFTTHARPLQSRIGCLSGASAKRAGIPSYREPKICLFSSGACATRIQQLLDSHFKATRDSRR